MRHIVSMLLMTALASSAMADDLVVKPASTFDQLIVSVAYQGRKIHKAHIIVRSENGLTIAEGETTRDGIARMNINSGHTLKISVKTPDGQENEQVYMHLYQ